MCIVLAKNSYKGVRFLVPKVLRHSSTYSSTTAHQQESRSALVCALLSGLTWMAFKSKYHMACVTSGDILVIKIHYAGVRRHWDAARCVASFGRLKIWRLRERVHYAVVILNNLLSLAHSPLLIHNSYDLQLARMPRLLCPCKRA